MSLESDRRGQMPNVFKNGRKSFAFLGLIAVCCMVPGESLQTRILLITQYWSLYFCLVRSRTVTKRSIWPCCLSDQPYFLPLILPSSQASLLSFLFFKPARYISITGATGALHMLFPLLRTLFFQISG